MDRRIVVLVGALACGAAAVPDAAATTREIAGIPQARLTFGQSVLNQLSYETYRDPFDELQTRPFNLLFNNIGRHPNLTPWQGQEGSHARYVNALIGNNGVANVDNDADAVQGSLIRRERATVAWGLSAAVLFGSDKSEDSNGTASFSDTDELRGIDLRGGAAFQLSERRVLGAGVRLVQAVHEVGERSFEPGVGGFDGSSDFDQLGISVDVGVRDFPTARSSWDVTGTLGFAKSGQLDAGETIDDTGAVTDRFVTADYDVTDLTVGVSGGYNRLRAEKLGEIEYRGGLEWSRRSLGSTALSYSQTGGVTTPVLTLLADDPVSTARVYVAAKTIYEAGETELFAGARAGYVMIGGSTRVDASGTVVNEEIDDSGIELGVTLGLRQPLGTEKIRLIVSGRGDLARLETATIFDAAETRDTSTLSAAQYAIGLEGVLANVTFDLAWLVGDEAPVAPVPIGVSPGSRRTVELNRLVFSAAVAW